jgi:hypothetical protein
MINTGMITVMKPKILYSICESDKNINKYASILIITPSWLVVGLIKKKISFGASTTQHTIMVSDSKEVLLSDVWCC